MTGPNTERQRAARGKLEQLLAHPESVLAIHYACESFDKGTRLGSPRITAIAVANLGSGETHAFSIHAEAELAGLAPVKVLSRLDALETGMLDKFFAFLLLHRTQRFVHWNMRDAVFGFEALEHRASVLGGQLVRISDTQKSDLARLLVDIYGTGYVASPPFETLARDNGLKMSGLLAGVAEADAFHRGDYLGVQRSVLCKVGLIADLVRLAHDRALKTKATWWTMNVGRLREAVELFDRNPVQAWSGLIFAGLSAGFVFLLKMSG